MNALAEIFYIAWGTGDAATPNIAVPTRVDLVELLDTPNVCHKLFASMNGLLLFDLWCVFFKTQRKQTKILIINTGIYKKHFDTYYNWKCCKYNDILCI